MGVSLTVILSSLLSWPRLRSQTGFPACITTLESPHIPEPQLSLLQKEDLLSPEAAWARRLACSTRPCVWPVPGAQSHSVPPLFFFPWPFAFYSRTQSAGEESSLDGESQEVRREAGPA